VSIRARLNRWVLRVLRSTYLGAIVSGAFLVLILLAALAVYSQWVGCKKWVDLWLELGGWVLGILLVSFGAFRVSRELALREWWRLREYEADPMQAEAKRWVYWLAGQPKEGQPKRWWQKPDVDRYREVGDRWSKLEKEERRQLDNARRRLSHFWGDVVELVERGVLDREEVWSAVGNPEIVYLLEALEVILVAEIKEVEYSELEPWPWGPAKVLGWWLERVGDSKAAAWQRGEIPTDRCVRGS